MSVKFRFRALEFVGFSDGQSVRKTLYITVVENRFGNERFFFVRRAINRIRIFVSFEFIFVYVSYYVFADGGRNKRAVFNVKDFIAAFGGYFYGYFAVKAFRDVLRKFRSYARFHFVCFFYR